MTICRSSERCGREAGHGTFGTFCEAHASELSEIKARWFTPTGAVQPRPVANTLASATEVDGRALTLEVLRTGRATRRALSSKLDLGPNQLDRAVIYSERKGWISRTRLGLEPGDVIPEGRLPREVRAAMLARFVRSESRTVSLDEAAAAIGLERGGIPRVVALARNRGWVTTSRGSGGITAAA
jgi:hypothetical protein